MTKYTYVYRPGDSVWCPYGSSEARAVVVDVVGDDAVVEVRPGTIYSDMVRVKTSTLLPRTMSC